MKILVTGVTGFLGSATALELKKQGHDVTVHMRLSSMRTVRKWQDAGFEVIFTSLDQTDRDAQIIKEACAKQDVVVNCAGLAEAFGRPEDFKASNVDFVKILADGCIPNKTRLIHVSSPSVYMNWQNQHNLNEKDPVLGVAGDYAASKAQGEKEIEFARFRGLRATMLRPHLVFGPGNELCPGDKKILGGVVDMHNKHRIPLFNDGKAQVDLTYIDNFVDAVRLCIENENSVGHAFNITNNEPQPVKSVLTKLFNALDRELVTMEMPVSFPVLGKIARAGEQILKLTHYLGADPHPFVTETSLSAFALDFTLDNSHAQNVLGYKPKVSLDEGLARFAQWRLQQEAKLKREAEEKPWSPTEKMAVMGSAAAIVAVSIFAKKWGGFEGEAAEVLNSMKP